MFKASTPNFSLRTEKVRFLVLHHTELRDVESVYRIFQDKDRKVSSHYLIGRDGSCHQFVDDNYTAYHAGISYWDGVENLNHHSIGIELDNNGNEPFTPKLMEATITLCGELIKKHDIKSQDIVAHSDIAYWRKVDPNVYLNWNLLAENGVGVVSKATADKKIIFTHKAISSDIVLTKHKLGRLGYQVAGLNHDEFCDGTLALFQAFKRRFVKESYRHNDWDLLCTNRLNDLLRIYGR